MAASGDAAFERDLEWLSLEDDESIVWVGGPDRRTLVPTLAIGIPLSLVLIGIPIIVGEYLRVRNTVYVITDAAVYRKTGVLSRDVKRIDHEKVQDISYSQSALGSAFGYGTVELTTAGGAGVEMAFRSVADPRTVQQRISERVASHREPEPGEGDVLEEILAELRAIRAILEDSSGRGDAPTVAGERPTDPNSNPARESDLESERRSPVRRERPPDDSATPTAESESETNPLEDNPRENPLEERSDDRSSDGDRSRR
ncbi:PH domain-containing protein [Natronococcus sp. JC468]|uniref:PH domain-containing protein n=1 Tax=Natronococcus sp. JC468 TaxID=1961921 RepID=UPI00143B0848|nr:PH domain-containing protein [Natronococcus sp. JC468]NKE35726.1 PH domain-containing protein [Natronococcus sp. JC468]